MRTKCLKFFLFTILLSVVLACGEEKPMSSVDPVNWEKRKAQIPGDSLQQGLTYLSVYSQIYSESEHKTFDLTATVSIRNTDLKDTLYLKKASYYNTHGVLIRNYLNVPVFVGPMETLEIVIDEKDQEGGTGANFLFEWTAYPEAHEPIFEAVMISTLGQQGLSFTTRGERLE